MTTSIKKDDPDQLLFSHILDMKKASVAAFRPQQSKRSGKPIAQARSTVLGFDLSSNAVSKLIKSKKEKKVKIINNTNDDATIAQWTSSLSSKLKMVKMIQ